MSHPRLGRLLGALLAVAAVAALVTAGIATAQSRTRRTAAPLSPQTRWATSRRRFGAVAGLASATGTASDWQSSRRSPTLTMAN
jgi:hypothetical protein